MSEIQHESSSTQASIQLSPLSRSTADSCNGEERHRAKFHHREASLSMDELSEFCESHVTTVENVCIVVWQIVLYHMTGNKEVSIDVERVAGRELALQDECEVVHSVMEQSTSALCLLSRLDSSATPTSLGRKTLDSCIYRDGGRHLFRAFQDEASFQHEVYNFASFKKGYVSHAHLLTEYGSTRVRVLWQDGLQDPDELISVFNHVYAGVLAQPSSSIQSIGGPNSNQLQQSDFGQTKTADVLVENDQRIDDIIRQRSLCSPSKSAIQAWDGTLTYAELDGASECWAKAIMVMNLTPEEPVLHCLGHSRWAIVAWLALLKAGHPCVPVDVSAPEDRLRAIIESTGCRVAICDEAGLSGLSRSSLQLLTPTDLGSMAERGTVTTSTRSASRIAAIMFTSGSTGKPKGVVQSHDAIASSLVRVVHALKLDESTKFLQFAMHCFDVSICEIFAPLVAGGCVIIPPLHERLSHIAHNINSLGVTHALLTPTAAKLLSPEQVPSLRSLSFGGEPSSPQLLKAWSPHLELSVLYGTTESAVWDTIARIPSDGCHDARNIGYPIGNRVWVVHPNDWTLLSPTGVPGELCIQGPEIADGYLGEPGLTDKAFKTHPPWLAQNDTPESGCNTIYLTGDLGRVLKDGSLEVLGRIDRQIKINGQRIEPAEIEQAFKTFLPENFDVFVDSLVPEKGQAVLTAFISHEQPCQPAVKRDTPQSSAIQDALHSLRKVLPSAMIPSICVPMTTFPLTTTNKINRQELRSVGLEFIRSSQAAHASASDHGTESMDSERDHATKVENAVQDFLKRRLRIDAQNLRGEDFALRDVGIDSIDAVALASLLKSVAQIDVPPSRLLSPEVRLSDIKAMSQCVRSRENPKSFLEKELLEWTAKLDELDECRVRSVLLTGANGFLGQAILGKLLSHTPKLTVICVVRGRDEQHARTRLLDAAHQAAWWRDSFQERLKVWLGDLAKPLIGLEGNQWQRIFGLHGQPRQVDAIIHNGAVVNWLDPYESLCETNVGSTYEFLTGLAGSKAPPSLIFVSGGYTSGVWEDRDELVEKICHLPAYDQTKFVSEALIEHVRWMEMFGGNRIMVFKPGFIIGSTEDGHTQTGDALWRLVKACVRAGSYSQDDARRWIPVAGVDTVASMLLEQALSKTARPSEQWFQPIMTGVYFQDIWDALLGMGIQLRPLNHEDWQKSIHKDLEHDGQAHPLFPLKDWFEGSDGFMGIEPPEEELMSSDQSCQSAELAVWKSLKYLATNKFFQVPVTTTATE